MSPLSHQRRMRLARFGLFVALAVGLGAGITTFANSAVGPRDAPQAVAEEPAVSQTPLPAVEAVDIRWPVEGAAAVAVGDGETLTPSDEPHSMASVTKLVTALMVQQAAPLALGDAGQSFHFLEKWNNSHEEYLARDESALPVPAGGVLTQYQLLQGMLLGSACNYADILVEEIWGDDATFAAAATEFLAAQGIEEMTVVEPTGIDPGNVATPSALIELGRLALADPVIAEIVAMPQVELPGAGLVENTNDLLADPGVVGIKTGTLDGSNLLSAKDITVGDETVRVFAVVLSQPDDEERFVASRALYSSVEAQLASTG